MLQNEDVRIYHTNLLRSQMTPVNNRCVLSIKHPRSDFNKRALVDTLKFSLKIVKCIFLTGEKEAVDPNFPHATVGVRCRPAPLPLAARASLFPTLS